MRPRMDLTGQLFGMLTVLSEAETIKTNNGNSLRRWVCRCNCGNEITVRQKDLTSGHTTSCGCIKGRPNNQPRDLIGQKFGRLTVLNETDQFKYENGKTRRSYECQCDCGNTVVVRQSSLLSGKTKSCGCLVLEGSTGVDLTGQRFGWLTVQGEAESKRSRQGKTYRCWKCRCDCGKELEVLQKSLVSGDTKSCGCKKGYSRRKNLVGRRYGKLTVLKEASPYITPAGRSMRRWLCECECGRKSIVWQTSLVNSDTKSCGCLRGQPKMLLDLNATKMEKQKSVERVMVRIQELLQEGHVAEELIGKMRSIDNG